jgi:streptogramin lyase
MTQRQLIGHILPWAVWVLAGVGWSADAGIPRRLTETHDIRVFDQADGMPYFAVSGLAVTPDGRLWIATFRDLIWYDGVGFRRETRQNGPDSDPLQAQTLRCDQQGRLWLGAGASIGCLEKGSWRVLGADAGVPRETIRHLAVRSTGEVWASWEGGMLCLHDGRCEALDLPPGTGHEACPLAVDDTDRVWCANRRGMWWRNQDRWQEESAPPGVTGQEVCGVGVARRGGLWVAYDREVWKRRDGHWEQRRERPDGMRGDAVTVLEDGTGAVWIGGWTTGLARLGRLGDVEVAGAGQGFNSSSVTSLIEDASGTIWVGINGGFLGRVRPLSFQVFGVESGLRSVVDSVAEETPGVLAVATHGGGLMRWKEGRFEPHPEAGAELGNGVTVQSVLRDHQGEWWVGTFEKGLMHGRNGNWETVSAAETGARIIRGLHEDRSGRLWVGTAAGLAVREAGHFRVLGADDGIPHMVVHSMAEDGEGRMWICGMGYGLFQKMGGRFERVPVPGMDERQPFASLAATHEGSMWVGILGMGVVRFKDGKTCVFGRESGLIVGDSVSLAEDGEGYLWIFTTDRCQRVPLVSFDAVASGQLKRLDVRPFDRRDGFPGAPRIGFHPTMTRSADGRLWWATAKGLAEIDAGGLPIRPPAPEIRWRWIRDKGRELAVDGESGPIAWPGPVKETFEMGFRSGRFDSPEHVRYEARLSPHGEWQAVLSEHRLSVSNLRPGTYQVEVRASDREGEWGEPSSVRFDVPEPFWHRSWFLGVVMTGLVGITVPAVRAVSLHRIRRRMRQLEGESLLAQERTRISQNLHDDVGASVTHLTLLLERACRVGSMPELAQEQVREGLRVARATLGSLDTAVWAVNPSNDTVAELVSYLGQMASEFCRNAGIRLVLKLPEAIREQKLGAE